MTAHLHDWRPLADRIAALQAAFQSYALTLLIRNDRTRSWRILADEMEGTWGQLRQYEARHSGALAAEARDLLATFVRSTAPLEHDVGDEALFAWLRAAIMRLGAFGVSFTAALQDRETWGRRRVERAFLHLQRQMRVDEACRASWSNAWNLRKRREERLESLGRVHFMTQGIHCFKARDHGGESDLIILPDGKELREARLAPEAWADAAVLTEWKIATTVRGYEKQVRQARDQAERYATEVFPGLGLDSVRYLVIVTLAPMYRSEWLRRDDGVHHRILNLAIHPGDASRLPPRRPGSSDVGPPWPA